MFPVAVTTAPKLLVDADAQEETRLNNNWGICIPLLLKPAQISQTHKGKGSHLDTRQRNGGRDGEGHGECDGRTTGDAAVDGTAEEFETKLSVRDLFCQLSLGLFLILGRLRTTFWQPRATSADSRYRSGTPLTVRRTAPLGSMDRRIARKYSSRPASSSRVGSLLPWVNAWSTSRAQTTPCVTPGRVSGSMTSATKPSRGGGSYWMSIASSPLSKQLRVGSGGKISSGSISM